MRASMEKIGKQDGSDSVSITVIFVSLAVITAWDGLVHAETYHVQSGESIQTAIDGAVDGDEVVIAPGTYREHINFNGRNIVVRSEDPDDWGVVESTVLKGFEENCPVVNFEGNEDETCQLLGVTLTEGQAEYGGGINGNGATAGVSKCIIRDNLAYYRKTLWCDERGCATTDHGHGGGIHYLDGIIKNCIIDGNFAIDRGGGLADCDGEIVNCTKGG